MNLPVLGEKFAAFQTTNIETMHSLATGTLDRVERLSAFSLDAARATLEDGASTLQAWFAAEAPDRVMQVLSGFGKPQVERSLAYLRSVSELAADAQREFAELTQRWWGDQRQVLQAAFDVGAGSTRTRPEAVMAAIDSAASASKALYERIQRAGVAVPSDDRSSSEASREVSAKVTSKTSTARKPRTVDEGDA